ncbi:SGNH hydrolase-type esterase domain-containing protein [Lenzites betulinus]|nr:SGNH hydrolase-type esterase domain-containing protein [Lenzites betulinus]
MPSTSEPTVIRPSWRGFNGLRYLVIFGDSYSDVGFAYIKDNIYPSDDAPLGMEFPGVTWAELGTPNWVGHLITEYSPYAKLLVYDFAVGGDNVRGVRNQIHLRFLPHMGEKPEWAPWSAENSLFVTWVGINDCARLDMDGLPAALDSLFEEQEQLYNVGARNFLFIDVPPIHRSPVGAISHRRNPNSHLPYETWNNLLRVRVASFAERHLDVTTLFFSSWDTFTRVLDDPVGHGFRPDHVSKAEGDIWADQLHPSSRMHDWIAHDVAKFLQSYPAHGTASTEEESTGI